MTSLDELIKQVKEAQKEFSTYSQEQVDKIFKAASLAACKARIPLAKMAVEETGMGIVEDKIIKNHFASEYIYNAYKDTQTCGIVNEDKSFGFKQLLEPIGLIGAVIPTTNPTSTTIFKALLCLKTRNGVIFSPHPRAKKCTCYTAKLMLEAAVAAGAPKGIIACIEEPSLEATTNLMKSADLTLATGGPSMVRSAYSSGKPAIGVGSGNVPAVIDNSADIILSVNSIIHSKIFDNGMICASEQSVIVVENIYEKVKAEFMARGCYFLTKTETQKLRDVILVNGALNAKIVGQPATTIAQMANITVPSNTKVLIGETEDYSINEAFAHEKLSPILAMYKAKDFNTATNIACQLIEDGGLGHTASLFIGDNQKEKETHFTHKVKACRVLVNSPSTFGGIGDIYNFKLLPSLTLGCGSYGGNSVSENVGVKHLLNLKTIAERRENMLWFKTPASVYIKQGCLPIALTDLKGKKKAFIVTDSFLFKNGFTKQITDTLKEYGIDSVVFSDVEPDPTLLSAKLGARAMLNYGPDTIIAIGGGSAMDAAKIMWVLYEHPNENFEDLAMRFSDIRKRIYPFPKMGVKANFVAIPTTSGTGSEVTPFAVITDEQTGIKYPLADYELMPNIAIIDVNLHMTAPKGLTAASGIDTLSHAFEAYASMLATDYTDSYALKSIKMTLENLPEAYKDGNNVKAREQMANAATMAGIAFANAFLGICHSMAHKLGAYFNLPHGLANALLLEEVMRFNSVDVPTKQGLFPQYTHPHTISRYAEIADYLKLKGKTDEEKLESLIVEINKLKKAIDIKPTIKDYVQDEKAFLAVLDEMSERAFDDQCTGANPRYPLIEEIKQLYKNAYYGGERKKV